MRQGPEEPCACGSECECEKRKAGHSCESRTLGFRKQLTVDGMRKDRHAKRV